MEAQSPPLDLFATGLVNLESRAGNIVGGGRYSLIRVLGRGGMGIVWLARDARLNSEVALKFLPPQIRYDSAALDDLRRETARSRKLSHPNIIRIHDLYEAENEDAFISMEYIEGRNLADLRVDQSSRVFSWEFLKPLVEQLCAGLEYAHNEGIIHCDLKPANLMLDAKGRLKLADFGIARTVSDSMTRNSLSQTSGTLLYMSPQQMEGRAPRVTDDIYALGATLYELMTGKPPFFTGDIMHQVRLVTPRPMQERLRELELKNDVPAEVEQVIVACLSKNPAVRPQSALDVTRLLNGEKIEKRTRLQIPKIWKERKWLVTAGAAALAIGIGVVAFQGSSTGKKLHVSSTKVAARVSIPEEAPVVKQQEQKVSTVPTVVQPTKGAAVQQMAASTRTTQPVTPPSSSSSTGEKVNRVSPTVNPSAVKAETTASSKLSPKASESTRDAGAAAPAHSISTSSVPVVLSKATALQLLQKGNSHVSARSKDRVLEVISSKSPITQPPQSWRIIYHDDKTTYNVVEVRFEGGEMERVYEPNRLLELLTPGSQKILDLAKVKIDSDKAIRIASDAAATEEFVVQSVEAKLERGYGGLPVWNVKLFGTVHGKAGDDVGLGYVIVLAENGKILKNALTAAKAEKPLSKK